MPRKRKSKKRSKKKIFHYSRYIIAIVIILVIIVIALILIEGDIASDFKTPKVKEIQLTDKCTLVLGNLIHQIKNEEDCILQCKRECTAQDMNYQNVAFEFRESDCHNCKCFCN